MSMFVVGTVMKGVAGYQQGQAEASMYNEQAGQELAAGQQAAGRIRQRTRQERGAAVASYAASGVRVGEGSALAVERQILQTGEEDALTTLLNADRRARSYRNQAAMSKSAGKFALLSSMFSAGSLLSSGSSLSGWDAKGFNGTNDRSRFSVGSNSAWWARNGQGGD